MSNKCETCSYEPITELRCVLSSDAGEGKAVVGCKYNTLCNHYKPKEPEKMAYEAFRRITGCLGALSLNGLVNDNVRDDGLIVHSYLFSKMNENKGG